MRISRLPLTVAALCLSVAPLFAAKPYEEMDFGRFLSATFNNAQGKPTLEGKGLAANKGIAIRLGKEGKATMLFDTDLVRFAGAWTDGFLDLVGVAYDGKHGPNPKPAKDAKLVFETNPTGPGWSNGDDFKDPRALPTGPGAAKIPFGPLPAGWAKYKGLYLHGDDVVVAYTVGAAQILEMPGLEETNGQTFLTRTVQVLGQGNGSSLLVTDGVEGAVTETQGLTITVKDDPKVPDSRLLLAAIGLPKEAAWETGANGRVQIKFSKLAEGQTFKLVYWKGSNDDLAKATDAVVGLAQPKDLRPLTKGGPAHWAQEVTATGTLAKPEKEMKDGKEVPAFPYVVDTIGLPVENPYKSWIRVGALDFFSDGRLAFSTWNGDVWIGKGIDAGLEKITWHRFATGLFQPLGLKIVDDQIYVLGRDQITRLADLNGDGEADLYENFNNDVQVTPGFHEFAFDLQTDPQGNFYFSKGGPVNPGGRGWGPLSEHNGCLFKISKDGSKFEVFATGLRAPNGIGISPKGEVSVGDNQGTWVPADYIHFVKQGEFIEVPDLGHKDPIPEKYAEHLCWIPYGIDNSCGSHVWVTSDKFGPLGGEMLYLSYGKSSIFRVLREQVGEHQQGGVVKLPLKFDTGVMRARFNPADGQLYLAGLKGWQTNGAKDGALHRVRYTGAPLTLESGLKVTDKGIHLAFSNPVDAATAGDVGNYSIKQYNYRWTKDYGSPDFKVSDPSQKGADEVEIKSVKVSPDKKSVFLEVPGLQPVMQMRISLNIKGEDGAEIPNEIANTINVVGKE